MTYHYWLALLCLVCAGEGRLSADIPSYSGNFQYDDDLQLISVPLTGSATKVVVRTTSFAAGGFAPALSFFGPDGLLIGMDVNGNSGGCITPDSMTGFCWDSYLSFPQLGAGIFTLALTQDDNTALGPYLADGFLRGTGQQNNFTGPQFIGTAGSFILVDGSQRTSAWAVEIGQTTPVPEPSSAAYLAAVLATLGLTIWKAKGVVR